MSYSWLPQLTEIYDEYRNVVKPLIAEVESLYEEFPLPIHNEVRALHDHISRCFESRQTSSEIDGHLNRASAHNRRMIFDCYKFLNVYYNDQLVKFEKHVRNIDLTTIDSGTFYIRYLELSKKAREKVREAKKQETKNTSIAFEHYEDAYNIYVELYDLITAHLAKINWARAKFSASKFVLAAIWLASLFITSVITNNNQLIVQTLQSYFSKVNI